MQGFHNIFIVKEPQVSTGAFEHSVLCIQEIYALENVWVLHCSLWPTQTINFPIYATQMCSNAPSTVDLGVAIKRSQKHCEDIIL